MATKVEGGKALVKNFLRKKNNVFAAFLTWFCTASECVNGNYSYSFRTETSNNLDTEWVNRRENLNKRKGQAL